MTPQDFLDQVITPALVALGLDSVPARQLLLGTALRESGLRDIDQIGGGPAQGPFQIEPATRADIRNWVFHRHPDWCDAALRLPGEQHDAALCRLIYERAPGVIGSTPEEQAAYYKQWYNTPLGKATVAEYLANWKAAEGVDFERPFEGAPAAPVFAGENGGQQGVDPAPQVVDQEGLIVQETDLGPIPPSDTEGQG